MALYRQNNFGFLRLMFAALVIVSHSPELVDGNRSREILTRLFGTLSFGEVAVDGFFLVSGYLITQSFVRRTSTLSYLKKRVLRIVPAYLVCFLLCLLLEAPLAGNDVVFSPRSLLAALPQVLTLSPPALPGVFSGLPYPLLNGAMWTIAYEFRCYLLTVVLGLVGIFSPRGRFVLAAAVAILLVMNASGVLKEVRIHNTNLVGGLPEDIRFFAVFGVGALYYLFREWTELTHARAGIAVVGLVALMFSPRLAEAAYAILGGYLILWCALKLPTFRLSRLDDQADISYGLYLYAWPVQTLIIWNDRTINPWLLCGITLVLASLLGFVSWILVEKPSLSLAVRRHASLA